MTSRTEASSRVGDRGFTLLEMLVVLVVLGLVGSIALLRGPLRGRTLELGAASGEIVQALRGARSRAIATGKPVVFRMDAAARSFAVDDAPPRSMPASIAWHLTTDRAASGGGRAGIVFEPDGSSSGGRIDLAQGTRHTEVSVGWLTGRVSVEQPEAGTVTR